MPSSLEFIQVLSLQTSVKYRKKPLQSQFAFYPSFKKIAFVSFTILKTRHIGRMSASSMIYVQSLGHVARNRARGSSSNSPACIYRAPIPHPRENKGIKCLGAGC